MSSDRRGNKGGMGQHILALACIVIVGLVVLTGICYGLWRALSAVSHGALAALALGAILVVPVAGLTGWRLGHLEARGVLSGLGLGVNSVLGAAADVADVRVNTIRTVREVYSPSSPQAVLPPVIDVTPNDGGTVYL